MPTQDGESEEAKTFEQSMLDTLEKGLQGNRGLASILGALVHVMKLHEINEIAKTNSISFEAACQVFDDSWNSLNNFYIAQRVKDKVKEGGGDAKI